MSVQQAAADLEAAVRQVDGVRFYRDPSAAMVDPPAALVGPPRITFDGMCPGPTAATFVVYVLASMDERAVSRLWDLVPLVAEAIDEQVRDAVVTEANPGVFDAGGNDLPSYEITVEVAL